MKKVFFVMLSVLGLMTLAACGKAERTYYFAIETPTQDSEWLYWVEIVKEGDKIVEAKWDGLSILGDTNKYAGKSKYQASKDGLYDMHPGSTEKNWWHDQADKVTAKLIETQNYNDREPLPAGVTITTDNFYVLVEKALASDPIEKGEYKDGYYFFTAKDQATKNAPKKYWDPVKETVIEVGEFDYYNFGSIIVVNGRIVFAYFDAAFKQYRLAMDETGKVVKHTDEEGNTYSVIETYDANKTPKLYSTKNQLGFSYAMKKPNGPGSFEFFEQMNNLRDYLIENQTLPEVNEDDGLDDVAGVTIKVAEFVDFVKQLPKA